MEHWSLCLPICTNLAKHEDLVVSRLHGFDLRVRVSARACPALFLSFAHAGVLHAGYTHLDLDHASLTASASHNVRHLSPAKMQFLNNYRANQQVILRSRMSFHSMNDIIAILISDGKIWLK